MENSEITVICDYSFRSSLQITNLEKNHITTLYIYVQQTVTIPLKRVSFGNDYNSYSYNSTNTPTPYEPGSCHNTMQGFAQDCMRDSKVVLAYKNQTDLSLRSGFRMTLGCPDSGSGKENPMESKHGGEADRETQMRFQATTEIVYVESRHQERPAGSCTLPLPGDK